MIKMLIALMLALLAAPNGHAMSNGLVLRAVSDKDHVRVLLINDSHSEIGVFNSLSYYGRGKNLKLRIYNNDKKCVNCSGNYDYGSSLVVPPNPVVRVLGPEEIQGLSVKLSTLARIYGLTDGCFAGYWSYDGDRPELNISNGALISNVFTFCSQGPD